MNAGAAKGRFIALEGGEGAGKSTQVRLLAQALRARGIAVDVTREPGGTPGAEAIRSLLLDPPGERRSDGPEDQQGNELRRAQWGARAEALLFAAARADHVERRIRPALERGMWVVCDRFVDSSRAYQGGAGGLGDEMITTLHALGSEGLRPDLTVLLKLDPERAAARALERDGGASDAISARSAAYHARVAASFAALAKADPEGFAVIDADGAPDAVHARVLQAIDARLGGERA